MSDDGRPMTLEAYGGPLEPREHDGGLEAEQSVLGALMLDNAALPRALPLSPRDFVDPRNAAIFAAECELIDAGEVADPVTVRDRLASRGDECGGMRYLNELVASVPSAANVDAYARLMRTNTAKRVAAEALDRARRSVRDDPGRATEILLQAAATIAPATSTQAGQFRVVDMAHIESANDSQPWPLQQLIPPGEVTLLGAHGGTGKSTLGEHIMACIAGGIDAFGMRTQKMRCVYFDAEDPARVALSRFRRTCHGLGLDFDEISAWAQILDASDLDPVLFTERRIDGMRVGVTTPTYDALRDYIRHEGFEVLIVDNASDVFDADEIARPLVRKFIRALKQLVPPHGAVLLLAHVDKSTSRAARGFVSSEAYSGSTAWHNSVRSRLYLREVEPGLLELQHQKSNRGPRRGPLMLEWPQDGVMQVQQSGGLLQAIESKSDTKALLALIHEFAQRGEFVAASTSSRHHAAKLFAEEKTYPKHLGPQEVFAVLRDAEREGLIGKERYQDANRKWHECWSLKDGARALLGIAPSAPCAPTYENEASHG